MGAEVQGTGIKIKTLVDGESTAVMVDAGQPLTKCCRWELRGSWCVMCPDDGTGRNKVFINVCGFEGVEVPKTASGLPADKLDCPSKSTAGATPVPSTREGDCYHIPPGHGVSVTCRLIFSMAEERGGEITSHRTLPRDVL